MLRTLLRATAFTSAMLAGAGGAFALDKVAFGTNWVAEPEHGGFYQAAADGTYAKCGLEVDIIPGGPQVNNRAKMLAGKIQFHMGGNMLQMFSAIKEGIPMTTIASFFQKEPQVIMTHPGQGLDSWESLKSIDLLLGTNGFQSFYRWMMAEYGFKASQRKPYTYNPAPFLANKRVGQQGYVTSEPFAIETKGGFKPNVFLLADYGFDTYSTTIEVMLPYMQKNKKQVQCFINGSIIGWNNYLYGDGSKGNALIQKHNPDMSDAQIKYSIDVMKNKGIVDSGESLKLGIGAMTDARHKSFYDKMVKAGVTDGGLGLSKAYTLEFINKGVGLDIKKKLSGS